MQTERERRAAEQFQIALGVSATLARLLAARGWRETAAAAEFLYPRLEHSHSPWLMRGMEAAVERLLAAITAGEAIRILGDYDADGTLATVILRQALVSLGGEVSYRLPERLGDGYGLTTAAIEQAAEAGVKLAVTVDTGIREVAALRRARELGLDVIVTDHHLAGAELPPALAVLNPHQTECGYPDKGLCGSGIAFKLTHALLERSGKLEGPWPPKLRSYLKLVALATVADAVPLVGENRVLARFGLLGLAEPVNPGLRALMDLAMPQRGAGQRTVRGADIAFRIAPRLNAAGRMGRADDVVELFFAPAQAAAVLAQKLEALNLERQQLCERIQTEIEARLAAAPAEERSGDLLVLAGEGWHRGVLGIVASRVVERTGKAAAVIGIENGMAYGSCRAPAGMFLMDRLDACGDLLERYGGHAQAAGFTLATANLKALEERLRATGGAGSGETDIRAAAGERGRDGFEVSLRELTPVFARELQRLEPFGEGNPEPWFWARGVTLAATPQRLKERHLKLILEQDGTRLPGLYWNLWREGEWTAAGGPIWDELVPGKRLDVRFRLGHEVHPEYGERVQLILKEFFVTAGAAADSHKNAEYSL